MDNDKILKEFNDNLNDYFTVSSAQRQEIYRSFLYMDNHNVESHDDMAKASGLSSSAIISKLNGDKRKTNISLLPAIVCGVFRL